MDVAVSNLSFCYPDGTPVFEDLSLRIRGERVALIGPNGSGKSTLLALLCGAMSPQKGTIALEGQTLTEHDRQHSFGMVFQDPDDQLFMATVLEDVGFGMVAHGATRGEADEASLRLLEELGISHLAPRAPHRLSGGEKRLVATAGALVGRPKALLFDEPSSALDPKARRRIIELFLTLPVPFIMTTHDLDMAEDLCDQVILLSRGSLGAQGGPELLRDGALLSRFDLELPLRYQ